MNFQGRDIISMNDLTREEINYILSRVPEVQKQPNKASLCNDKVSAMLFL